ncbi:MAG TPA: L-seryl-tRNA(Sec) selenium transferase, partial [Acidimicrobiales bacterium]|nr:L-seryl-tRNA(Sec) selenium transferase [Acidimicrobiales bacterium]
MRPPSVDALARSLADTGLPHPLLVDAARDAIAAGDPESAAARAEALSRSLLGPVINATGVLLHTNLGRAPLAASPDAAPTRGLNLELELSTGRRGSRQSHTATLLARAVDCDAALVVNNGAAAVLLVLATMARDRPVVVSRGELVEIGGGFRIPEVLAASGATLVEVGTTNRTRLSDYAAALAQDPALLLKVHQSNYRMVGFTESASVAELATLGPPVVVDIGSGLLDERTPWLPGGPPPWLADEPAARQTLEAGAALVTFSGDKLLGGPQAGVIAGRADLVAACARHPLARALRPGGLVLGALQDTLLAYLRRDAAAIPFWRMATTEVRELRRRAATLGVGEPVDCASVAGGGSLPGLEIPSAGVALPGDLTAALRAHDPPVIARVVEHRTVADLRTVDPADDPLLSKALSAAAVQG